MMQYGSSNSPAGLSLTPRESDYYQQLYALADTENAGAVGGMQAVAFFSKSGLDKGVLKQIWDIADAGLDGALGPDGFSVALRLIGHVQTGAEVSVDLAQREPSALPRFEGIPPPTAPSNNGFGSSARRGRSPIRGADRPVPSTRDMRKYARLFLRRDGDQDGLVNAQEAQELFTRSGLDSETLAHVWDLSDADRDGQLCWPEFVLAMHLIRRARAKEALGQLARELMDFLGSVEPPQHLAAQHSVSPSPGAVSAVTSAADASWSPVRTDAGMGQQVGDAGAGFGTSADAWGAPADSGPMLPGFGSAQSGAVAGDAWGSSPKDVGQGFGSQGFGDTWGASPTGFAMDGGTETNAWNSDGFADSGSPKKKKGSPTSSGKDLIGMGSPTSKSTSRHMAYPQTMDSPYATGGDGSHSPDFGRRARIPSPARDDSQPVEHMEVLIEADKVLGQGLRRDVDELDEELTRLEEACRFEEREAIRERAECERIGQEREHLTQQLSASQRQLAELKIEHEGIVLENVMLRCDHDHFGKEAGFLRRLLDEGQRDAEALKQSIEYLETSNRSLIAHTKSLEEARREVLDTVKIEKELLRKEREEAEYAKKALEALRRDGVDGLVRMGATRPATEPGGLSSFSAGIDAVQGLRRPATAQSGGMGNMGGSMGGMGGAGGASGAGAPWHSGLQMQGGPDYTLPMKDPLKQSNFPAATTGGQRPRVPTSLRDREGV